MARTKSLAEAVLLLKECLCEQLALKVARGVSQDVCICFIAAGDNTPFDYCGPDQCREDQCGQAWVRVQTVIPLVPDFEGRAVCDAPLQAVVEVGITRCETAIFDGHSLPDEEAHLADVLTQLEDFGTLRAALRCCDLAGGMGEYVPLGPEGGCVGGMFTVTIDIT